MKSNPRKSVQYISKSKFSHEGKGYLAKVPPVESHSMYFCQFKSCIFVSWFLIEAFFFISHSQHMMTIQHRHIDWQKKQQITDKSRSLKYRHYLQKHIQSIIKTIPVKIINGYKDKYE